MSLSTLNISQVIFESAVSPTEFLPEFNATSVLNSVPIAAEVGFLDANIRFETKFASVIEDPIIAAPEPPIGAYDPPFPPVWPYLFSTDIIYGRDNVAVVLSMIRGDTFRFQATAVFEVGGTPVDLSGATIACTAKYDLFDTDLQAVFKKTTASGIIIDNPTGGVFTVTILPADTNVLPNANQSLWLDVQITTATGDILTGLRGRLNVLAAVTTS